MISSGPGDPDSSHGFVRGSTFKKKREKSNIKQKKYNKHQERKKEGRKIKTIS